MAVMDRFDVQPLPEPWREEARIWQDSSFPEISEVQDESQWRRYYPELPTTNLVVIQARPEAFAPYAAKSVGATPDTADLSGRVWRAEDLSDDQFHTALKIIKAQASTELGSIQQHRMVYTKMDGGGLTGMDSEIVEGLHNEGTGHTLDAVSFSAKRVCVEELRHHIQMNGVLALDPTWDQRDGRKWATETLEELFAMKPGEHVLDAFNIEFQSILDTATFLALIDRVGKYQLEMQHHFLYGPMALSMPYMRYMEESYHLAAGERLMKALAAVAVRGGKDFRMRDVQQTVNMWLPRGMEMFGSELSGENVKSVFKTMDNAAAQQMYAGEVEGKVQDVNLAAIAAKAECDRAEARRILHRILERGETVHGLGPDDLLRAPHRRFFRFRGLTEFAGVRDRSPETGRLGYAYMPYDVAGNLLTHRGEPVAREDYVEYLKTVLPERLFRTTYWRFVRDEFILNPEWDEPANQQALSTM